MTADPNLIPQVRSNPEVCETARVIGYELNRYRRGKDDYVQVFKPGKFYVFWFTRYPHCDKAFQVLGHGASLPEKVRRRVVTMLGLSPGAPLAT